MAVTNIGLKIILAGRIGVSGVAYATIVAQVVCVLIPCLVYVPRVLTTVERSNAEPFGRRETTSHSAILQQRKPRSISRMRRIRSRG